MASWQVSSGNAVRACAINSDTLSASSCSVAIIRYSFLTSLPQRKYIRTSFAFPYRMASPSGWDWHRGLELLLGMSVKAKPSATGFSNFTFCFVVGVVSLARAFRVNCAENDKSGAQSTGRTRVLGSVKALRGACFPDGSTKEERSLILGAGKGPNRLVLTDSSEQVFVVCVCVEQCVKWGKLDSQTFESKCTICQYLSKMQVQGVVPFRFRGCQSLSASKWAALFLCCYALFLCTMNVL